MGGVPKDCSVLDLQCQVGVCEATTGTCVAQDAPVGTSSTHNLQQCQEGACDASGTCRPSMAPNGSACNDFDACTQGDRCTVGVCGGDAVAGCTRYLYEGFETCPDGWTLKGDWQCGTPTSMSPVTPFSGQGVLATQLDGLYHNNQTFSTCTADSPPIDLTLATHPQLAFWGWVSTDVSDGWNMKVSTDGGASFQEIMAVVPPYPLMIAGQPGWGGDQSAQGWQPYSTDLTTYAGKSIILRFAFSSDTTGVAPGVYLDELVVAEPLQIPLFITTSSLGDGYVGKDYDATITRIGGTSSAVWTIDTGGVNDLWLQIDPATGVLSGTPKATQTGPVSFTVHVQEPGLPSNFAEQTFTFNVNPDVYYTSWEGACPDGWTLTGDWKCGVPMHGPATASDGTQCIGTGMSQDYSDNDTWAGTTATSPLISLAGVPSPTLTFRMWVDTEGGTLDGANLEISTDGGMTYSVLNTVTPAYGPMMIAGQPAWGGTQTALGWQLTQADLTPYAGQTIYLRFAFQSDSSGTTAGVYVDDLLVE